MGVSTEPCGVSSRPRRAAPSVVSKVKWIDMDDCRLSIAECRLIIDNRQSTIGNAGRSVAPKLQSQCLKLLLHLVERGDAKILGLHQLVPAAGHQFPDGREVQPVHALAGPDR